MWRARICALILGRRRKGNTFILALAHTNYILFITEFEVKSIDYIEFFFTKHKYVNQKWVIHILIYVSILYSYFSIECKKTMADIVFLLDDSQHMSVSSSKKVIQFVKDVVTNFKIGANYVRVGSVSSSSLLENNFHLNRHFKLNNLLNAIDSIRHRNRNSTLSSAFDYLRTQSFTVANGDRVGIPNVLVMVTDGRPENESQTLKAAKALKDSGVIIFVISVGKSVQHPDLIFLASESSSKSVYTVNNFGVLDEITTKITKLICTGLYQTSSGVKSSYSRVVSNNRKIYLKKNRLNTCLLRYTICPIRFHEGHNFFSSYKNSTI